MHSFILAEQEFPTKLLEDLADELEDSVPGTDSDEARKTFDRLAKEQRTFYEFL